MAVRLLLMVLLAGGLLGRYASGQDTVSANHPVGWRGDGTGKYPSATPPTKWSSQENVLWKAEVGTGSSSPTVVGQRVLVCAEPNLLICLDANTGKELWRKAHKAPNPPNQYGDATPTPVSDGKSVWVFFGGGTVACHELDGTPRWETWFDLPQTTNYGRTVSPLLVGQKLLVHFGPLVCLDAASGKILWKNDTVTATYGTPVPTRIGDVEVLITPEGHIVRLSDGKILASQAGHCMYTSPLVDGRLVYFIDSSSSAVQLPEKAGEQIEVKELWYEDLTGEFFASPIIHGGRIYAVDRAANYFVIDPQTGKPIVKKTLDLPPAGRSESPNVYPSLCLAGKNLFVGNDAGQSLLLEAGDKCTVVASNTLPAGSGATPVFTDRRIFLRGGKLLYCIGPAKN